MLETPNSMKPQTETTPITAADIDFLMLGCPRCGTTWVDKALRDHPEIYLPTKKQTYFFDSHYDRGIDWYLKHFDGVTSEHKMVGEIATQYSQPHLVKLVAEHFPDAKLLLAVRNPADRAYSFYQSRSQSFDWKCIEEALEQMPDILVLGQYMDQVEEILKYYDRDRLKILFFDDLKRDERTYYKSILQFLGVDENIETSQFGKLVQVTIDPTFRRSLRKMGLGPLIDYVSERPIGNKIREVMKRTNVRRYKPMKSDDRQVLLDFYKSHNARFEQFVGRDLSHWNR